MRLTMRGKHAHRTRGAGSALVKDGARACFFLLYRALALGSVYWLPGWWRTGAGYPGLPSWQLTSDRRGRGRVQTRDFV